MTPLDLSPTQLLVLAHLADSPTWPPPGERSRSEQAALSRSLKRLERRGLVVRERVHDLSRTTRALLTRAGRRLVADDCFARALMLTTPPRTMEAWLPTRLPEPEPATA